jgi:integrase
MSKMSKTSYPGVYQRRNGSGLVYVIMYRTRKPDGTWKQIAETIKTDSVKKARTELANRLHDVNGGETLPTNITFQQFVSDYWEPHCTGKLKPSTHKSHNSNLKHHILPELSGIKLKDVQTVRLARLLTKKREAGMSDKSRLNLCLLLSAMFNYAVSLKLLKISPLSPQDRPRCTKAEKPTLTPAQVQAVIAAVPMSFRAVLILLALTGLRIGEALGLKWKDIDLEAGRLQVLRSVWMGKEQSVKSRASVRCKVFGPVLKQALELHRMFSHYTAPEDFVFANGAGHAANADDMRKRVLYPAMDKAGITDRRARAFGFHLFRHTAGSMFHSANGGDLKQTSGYLGHGSVDITGDTYLHIPQETERANVAKLESAMFPSGGPNLLANVSKLASA